MYKVFYNQKPLFFTTDLKKNSDETPLFHIKFTSAESIINAFKSKRVTGVYIYHREKEKLQNHFLKKFPCIEAAGGIVEHSNGSYLFIYRNDKWDLPKGKIEKSEIIIDAAKCFSIKLCFHCRAAACCNCFFNTWCYSTHCTSSGC